MWLVGLHARPWLSASSLSGGRGGDWQTARSRDNQPLISQLLSLSLSRCLSLSVSIALSAVDFLCRQWERERERRVLREGGGNRQRRWQWANPASTHTYENTHTHSFLYSRKPCGRGRTAVLYCAPMFMSGALLGTAVDQLPKDGTPATPMRGAQRRMGVGVPAIHQKWDFTW